MLGCELRWYLVHGPLPYWCIDTYTMRSSRVVHTWRHGVHSGVCALYVLPHCPTGVSIPYTMGTGGQRMGRGEVRVLTPHAVYCPSTATASAEDVAGVRTGGTYHRYLCHIPYWYMTGGAV